MVRLTLEWDGDQDKLGFDDNFDLVDSIIYMMDYDVASTDGKVHDSHNGIKMTLERDPEDGATAQECLESIGDLFDDFCRQAQEFIDKRKEKEHEQN